jgi:hypothetical protein
MKAQCSNVSAFILAYTPHFSIQQDDGSVQGLSEYKDGDLQRETKMEKLHGATEAGRSHGATKTGDIPMSNACPSWQTDAEPIHSSYRIVRTQITKIAGAWFLGRESQWSSM